MALDQGQLIQIRRAIGDKPDDAELQTIFNRTGSVDELILEVLERRLANLKARPDSMNIPGEYSDSVSRQMEALQEEIDKRGGGMSRTFIVGGPTYPAR